ncbi:hypothetical protein [Flavobacterium sp. 140616W15]|uniref:hypothetical protein n=1 Tax=Flavobacterium sp. 140616W15 TaxID=2478552 RepID=UPI000F0C4ED9|nr:hypothetical protein [Flavobacterium sp. 140616W15]AYN03301.1 hypothetical protein EAG11_03280 [Flavobacterium sp. 140616W15]
MKRITINELPEIITEDVFNILVKMALESPQSSEWGDIYFYLVDNNYSLLRRILDKFDENQRAIEQAKEDSKSEEQRKKEKEDWYEFVKNADPAEFYGNMGEPETPQQYKDKYGVWPPGYDESGNKI